MKRKYFSKPDLCINNNNRSITSFAVSLCGNCQMTAAHAVSINSWINKLIIDWTFFYNWCFLAQNADIGSYFCFVLAY